MGALSMKERVIRALAESGYDATYVTGPDHDPNVHLSPFGVPDRVCWQAFRVAGHPTQPCFACWNDGFDPDECLAYGTEDCGRPR